ncbi:MAG: PP2C family protein-serine/threonine phosphatase, partial [Candidatus Poribacteria bacterium]|nr:PP2C family protein-serine/threonine phosphatase [Candidatus Poribacteria bacterium]
GVRDGTLKIHQLSTGGMVAGSFDFAEFENETVQLAVGDTILFYTDGITEAERDTDNAFYGEERLQDAIRSSRDMSAAMICKTIEDDLMHFIGKKQQTDDLTLVVVKATTDVEED